MAFNSVLFDVDGALVDSAPVVVDVFEEVLPTLGRPVPPRTAPTPGRPSLLANPSTPSACPNRTSPPPSPRSSNTTSTVAWSRRSSPASPTLRDLTTACTPLATATSKEEPLAAKQIEHVGLADCFTAIVGAADSPDFTKTTIVADALARLCAKGADVSRPALVDDRHYDLEGARANDIAVVGALWGCAKPGELDDADFLCATPAALRELLLT